MTFIAPDTAQLGVEQPASDLILHSPDSSVVCVVNSQQLFTC